MRPSIHVALFVGTASSDILLYSLVLFCRHIRQLFAGVHEFVCSVRSVGGRKAHRRSLCSRIEVVFCCECLSSLSVILQQWDVGCGGRKMQRGTST
jgi:hypothetical protein